MHSVLFGATKLDHIDSAVRGLSLAVRKGDEIRSSARELGISANQPDPPLDDTSWAPAITIA
ncbi:hypothetical protein A6F49_02320 [Enteractinococcus helveticum]|uniref:Uncharacterized protein n=1 Tax=Enteractinococcus helveticum TaxID=1837282 RepID=A0A1B7LUK5_9MICC|nr:hypothetical protein A6F49_02320 [Enteractinococcus helveticum]